MNINISVGELLHKIKHKPGEKVYQCSKETGAVSQIKPKFLRGVVRLNEKFLYISAVSKDHATRKIIASKTYGVEKEENKDNGLDDRTDS